MITRNDLQITIHQQFAIEPIEGKDAEGTMRRGCDILKSVGAKHWISSGNLLGVYRDHQLISHDTDIDVNVLMDWNTKLSNEQSTRIIKQFKANQFTLIYTTIVNNHFMQTAFMDEKSQVIFDIYYFYRGLRDAYAMNYNQEGIIAKPLRFVEKLGKLTFDGRHYPVPDPLDEFMVWRYGKDWKTPATKKVPWQEEASHLERWA